MTFYYIRKSGWDGNDGLSPVSSSYGVGPWLTIGKANAIVASGSTVYIGAGDYSTETIQPGSSAVTYIGDISGTYTSDNGPVRIFEVDTDEPYTLVKGVQVEGSHVYIGDSNCTIDACEIRRQLIVSVNCYPFTVKNSATGTGLNHGPSLKCLGVNNDLNVYFCTIHQLSGANACGVDIRQTNDAANIRFKNNVVVSNRNYCLMYLDVNTDYSLWDFDYNYYVYTSGSFVCGDNSYNTLTEWQNAQGKDSNSYENLDPTGADHYHLISGSTLCSGNATDLGIYYDIDLDTRPSGDLDIGCDQFTITQSGSILSDAAILATNQQVLLSNAHVLGTMQQTINSNARVVPSSSPDPFTFEPPPAAVSSFSLKTKDESKTMLLDAKLKHVCNHNLPSGKYTLNTCPRCLGEGFYFDIKFSPGGDVITLNEEEKLLQELVKITLTSKGNNPFHKEYGSVVSDSIGMLQEKGFREAKLKQSIIEAVLRLKYLQRERIKMGYRFSLKELIDKIDKIEIYEIESNPTWLGFKVQILTVEGETAMLQGSITL